MRQPVSVGLDELTAIKSTFVMLCSVTHQGLAADQVGSQPPPCSRPPAGTVRPRQSGQPCTSPKERTRTAAEPLG